MQSTLSLLLILLALSGPASAQSAPPAPDWTLDTADGESLTLSQVVPEQPVTLLLFWATWCPYCKALMPHLQSIRFEYGDQVRVLALDILEDGDPRAAIEKAGFDFTLLPEADPVAAAYQVRGTPGVFLVDGQRRIQFDLRKLPPPPVPVPERSDGHGRRAGVLAPYWSSEIRKAIDRMIDEAESSSG